MNPTISLAIDNCFASKRWTKPETWMNLVKDMGITLVEASADNECDPLYFGKDYINDWICEVNEQSSKTDVKVINLYSGHGTYSTLGLAHYNQQAKLYFRDNWIKAQMDIAVKLNAGMGFYAHAFDETVLQDPLCYENTKKNLFEDFNNIAGYGKSIGISSISVEQMYTPHQIPWTISGTKEMLESIYSMSKSAMYITIDLGHMNGQQYFRRLDKNSLEEYIKRVSSGEKIKRLWLGPQTAVDCFDQAVRGEVSPAYAVSKIEDIWTAYKYLFSSDEDSSVYRWLEELACYSPIIHLQQSDGKSSPHWSFTPEKNRIGIIDARDVLLSIAESYKKEKSIVPKCEHLVLTLEPFISTMGNVYDSLEEIRQSINYWRKFVPRDNMYLDEIIASMN